ncbi:camphor resistance protein CrcB [Saccharothrix saharensis]|uniref:Fluoride-specific ion channel FluC n=1 Tax=Saccharothrix saharensis TaxID=571190 RepID=A0A543JCE1_9PSEU|nr:fluoride efflux transporter CrcB [Saccharothrix saharensis]TQM80426.1 camphor resistance protein CrcB [Saccharothrix saharensis]
MTVLLVFVGAAVGASLRHAASRVLPRSFPWATLAVNVVGSFVLGCVAGASPDLVALLGTGLCGGLTTYSTFSYETIRLAEDGRYRQAFANVAASLTTGVAAAALGYALTR